MHLADNSYIINDMIPINQFIKIYNEFIFNKCMITIKNKTKTLINNFLKEKMLKHNYSSIKILLLNSAKDDVCEWINNINFIREIG